MLATLSNALVQANGAPVVVSAGSAHVAALHAQFAPHTSMAVIASMEGSTGKTPYERKADSYLLAHPDIMKFTFSPALEGPAAPLDFMQFGFGTGL